MEDILLTELQAECNRAARDFLALEGWRCPRAKVKSAVEEMLAGSRLSATSLTWLVDQISKLPAQAEPARRLHDLTQAIAALQAHRASGSATKGR